MDYAAIFMFPGHQIWAFLVTQIFTSLIYSSEGFHTAAAFFIALICWAWVYRIMAAILCKCFGLEGNRHGH